MKLLTKEIKKKLRSNYIKQEEENMLGGENFSRSVKPVVKLFNPMGAGTWLITDMDERGIMFGLCDLGVGCPELGNVALSELEELLLPFNMGIERDIHWEADKSLMEYLNEAIENQFIKA
jgi:hypothetical protein